MKRVLVTPLDWGLGHATRCIPVINEFLKQKCEVQIAGSGSALLLLQEEFPGLKFHELVSYNTQYSSWLPFMMKLVLQMPKFLLVVKKEHRQVGKIIEQEKIDIIVSDSRYGCYADSIPSVLINHQLNIIVSCTWLQSMVNYWNHKTINRFTQCWVPDFSNGITGKLTSPSPTKKVKYIGMLSRFEKKHVERKYNVLALISGPETQRTIFEEKLRNQLKHSSLTWFIVRGIPGKSERNEINEANHLPVNELNEVIESSEIVICRPGYTTVMDLWKLEKKVIFIPTPGQTEQEYLADELMKRKIAYAVSQDKFYLEEVLVCSKEYKGFERKQENEELTETIKQLLNEID
ncbi:MAG: hypothetical protein KF845_07490 [Cyclobacteriaceae bacterium]|nr:hypothetical protein [Cyclobacteriaceae bacterium]